MHVISFTGVDYRRNLPITPKSGGLPKAQEYSRSSSASNEHYLHRIHAGERTLRPWSPKSGPYL